MKRRLVSMGATLCLLLAATLALATGAGGAFRHGKEIVRIEAEPERAMAYGKSGLLLLVQFFHPYEKGLVRLRGDGSLDRSFGNRGRVMIPWDDVVVQGDGRILVLTTAETPGSTRTEEDPVLMRLLPNGKPDPSFGQGGGIRVDLGGQFDHGTALALVPGGKIVLAGRTASKGEPRGGEGVARTVVVRMGPGGTLDSSFADGGRLELFHAAPVFGLANGPHGTLMVATAEDGDISIGIFRLRSQGDLDPSYGNDGEALVSGLTPQPHDFIDLMPKLGVLPGGRIMLAGTISRSVGKAGTRYAAVAIRLRADGERDRSYGMRGYATAGVAGDFFPQSFAAQPNGRVLVVGDAQIRGGRNDILALAFSPKGKLDRGFGRRGRSRVQFAHESDGKDILLRRHVAILVGSSLSNRGSGRIAVARVPLGHRPVR